MSERNIQAIYPLSPMQQGMLAHTIFNLDSEIYIEQLSCVIHGNLHIAAFKQAWQNVLDRHDILRTFFVWENLDKPVQIVRKRATLRWQEHDWSMLAAAERQMQLEQFLEADRKKGFELSKAPLMRLCLIQMDKEVYNVVWSYHHMLLDGWCQALLLQEVLTFYEAACQSRSIHLAPPRPYRDYITWLQRQNLSQAETFWRQTLKGFSAPTPLVVDTLRKSNAEELASSEYEQVYLSEETTATLQSLAQKHHLTLNTFVQGAWALLLSRYSGEEDVVFGVTVSGRPAELAEVESMIGLFINTLPMRIHVPENTGLLPWFEQIQSQRIELHQYEYSPLTEIQGWSEVPRTAPLFESILVFQNRPASAALSFEAYGLKIQQVRSFTRTNYPLNVIVVPGQSLLLSINFDRHRFERRTITRMLGHLQTILREIRLKLIDDDDCRRFDQTTAQHLDEHTQTTLPGIAAQPKASLADLPLLTTPERQQLLVEWNDSARPYPYDRCVHQIFETQVERIPNAIAVVWNDQQLTYRALNTRANSLAHYLCAHRGVPRILVGVCIERSIDMVIALLAVLKAGGAYVPLDPTYPRERIAFMLADAQIPVVLTQRSLRTILPTAGYHTICLDSNEDLINTALTCNPENQTTPDHLAYVIYTSGSTGTPKGVMAPHRAINRLVCNTNYIALQPGDVIAQASNSAFDAATFEIWGALLNGARLTIMARDVLLSPGDFAAQLAAYGVTSIFITTSLFNQLARMTPDCFKHVREVLFGGEACDPQAVREVLAHDPPQRLLHVYGPTETTTFTTWYLIEQVADGATTIPIGRPLSNDQAYVLDRAFQPVPVGVEGELYIGGAGLAHGYFNRPALTGERFIPNPFAGVLGDGCWVLEDASPNTRHPTPNTRLYKTGDRVRYREDGAIEFLGRVDEQIKLRGFRIELGEINMVLERHPAVEMSIIVVYEDRPGQKQLVAYVVPRGGDGIDIQHVRSFIAERLPNYMLPAAYIILDALPINANGKIDRQALPPPSLEAYVNPDEYVAPRTPLEQSIAAIWTDVLGIERVSIHDDFFALGGHSLIATQLIFQLRDKLKIDLSLRMLYESPTITGIVKAIESVPEQEPDQHPEISASNGTLLIPALSIDLRAEVVLDPKIMVVEAGSVIPVDQLANPTCVFLTGATGFLGAYLLHNLLTQTNAKIYCLIRAAHLEEARNRIRRAMTNYLLWNEALDDRIIPIVGDLAQPRLGLGAEEFDRLASVIDVIYHNGALVNFIYSYSAMKAANVLGTQEMLRLATRHKLKPFHYISTLGVFSTIDAMKHDRLTEDVTPEHWEGLSGGYSQSKWVAEQIVMLAQARGIPTTIHRLGSVSGHSKTGAYQTGDFFCQMLKANLEIGCIGEGFLSAEARFTPVDYVSGAIVYLSRQPTSIGQVFHLSNTQAISATVMLDSLRSFGLPFRIVSDRQWRQEMIAAAQHAPESVAARLVPFLPPDPEAAAIAPLNQELAPIKADPGEGVPQSQSRNVKFACPKTLEFLADSGISCPALNMDLMNSYIRYLADIGFIEIPSEHYNTVVSSLKG